MRDDPDRTHGDDPKSAAPSADDTELIAYLDGELDAASSVRVEARLARDPAARAAAEAYKKSYDLLDYLPKPEPRPDFTARTITRLQPITVASPVASGLPAAAAFDKLARQSAKGAMHFRKRFTTRQKNRQPLSVAAGPPRDPHAFTIVTWRRSTSTAFAWRFNALQRHPVHRRDGRPWCFYCFWMPTSSPAAPSSSRARLL